MHVSKKCESNNSNATSKNILPKCVKMKRYRVWLECWQQYSADFLSGLIKSCVHIVVQRKKHVIRDRAVKVFCWQSIVLKFSSYLVRTLVRSFVLFFNQYQNTFDQNDWAPLDAVPMSVFSAWEKHSQRS